MGDTFMCTDNPILLKNTVPTKTIICPQKKAEKKIPSESDIIETNKLAFNDDIGKITNYVTSMFERQAEFAEGSAEYEELAYRIRCGQKYQQDTIDRIKGVTAKPMPSYWYNLHECVARDGDDAETVKHKQKNMALVASRKPYFMIYVYPQLKASAKTYFKNHDYDVIVRFGKYGIMSVSELANYEPKTTEMITYLNNYYKYMPVGISDCVVNRICRIFEDKFDGYLSKKYKQPDFDYTIMKSGVSYSKKVLSEVKIIYKEYIEKLNDYQQTAGKCKDDSDYDAAEKYHRFVEMFREECEKICSNEDELCDIVIDLCYQTSKTKQFAWDVCGDKILQNLLKNSNYTIHIPVRTDDDGDFEYSGEHFAMQEVKVRK